MATYTGDNIDNVFTGGPDADTAEGNGGNDVLIGLGGDDRLDGGDGNDELNGGDNNDVLIGGAGSDSLTGGNGNDQLYAYQPQPGFGYPYDGVSIDVLAEPDTLAGGGGDDYVFIGYGDTADGGANEYYGDRLYVSFRGATSGVNADFRKLETDGSITIGGATITGFEYVDFLEGSEFDDTLATIGSFYPTSSPIYGRGGNDHIIAHYYSGWGGGGIWGGDGDDLIDATGAQYGPRVFGEAGNDTIIGGSSYERFEGGDGNDVIRGNYGFDDLYGDAGDDDIDGGSFGDNLFGGSGNDILYGAGDADRVDGGDGNDLIYGDFSLISSAGGLSPASNDDQLTGGLGDDVIHGDGGNDTINGGGDADMLYGDDGNDVLNGGDGNDVIDGGAGDDSGYGGIGDDLLRGNGGDQLSGEAGNDRIYFGASLAPASIAAGGDGSDQLILQGNYAGLSIGAANMSGIETLRLLSASDDSYGGAAAGSFGYTISATDAVVPAGGTLRIDAAGLAAGEALSFNGAAESNGRFDISAGAGADTLVGGAGGDRLDGGAGADTLRGGLGNDVYLVDSASDTIVEAADAGIDEVQATATAYSLEGSEAENLTGLGSVDQTLRGNARDNRIDGGAGRDVLFSGGGQDILLGGAGNDALVFGASLTNLDVADGNDGSDTLVVQGNYAALTLGQVVNVEVLLVASGADTRFGDNANDSYDYNITTIDSNVAAGFALNVAAADLRQGEDLRFDGSAETSGLLRIVAGRGDDTLIGGGGGDGFFFGAEGNLTGADRITGGGGIDSVALRGNYVGATALVFQNASLAGVEVVALLSGHTNEYGGPISVNGFDYDLTFADGNIAAGGRIDVNAIALAADESIRVDASAELDGTIRILAGAANDVLLGGAGADQLFGGLGADTMNGNGGADLYVYRSALESTSQSRDTVTLAGGDRIDLSYLDANAGTGANDAFIFVGSSAFSGAAGELRAFQGGGQWTVEGDLNGDGVADLVIAVSSPAPLTAADFVL